MSINRDEALRAKDIAEGMMKKADFIGARRLVLRAQKLDSSLENISHMMMVCDVHCVAAEKLSGNEMDWYGILQVEQKADDVAIKKQYKKLALLLHPDKNKLPGAEAAFKLIGEAQRILLDKEKRSLHDMKRRPVNRPAPAPAYRPHQVPVYDTHPVFWTNHNTGDNFTGFRPENKQQEQKAQAPPPGFCVRGSFWTSCPFCHTRYEYARVYINRNVNCLNCKRQFTTFEVPGQGAPGAKSSVQTTFRFPQQNSVPTQGACNARQKHPEDSTSHFSRTGSFPVSGCTAKGMGQKTSGFPQQQNVPNRNPFNLEQKLPQTSSSYDPVKDIPVSGSTVKVGTENVRKSRKRKKVVESSESSDSESSSDSEEDIIIEENGDVVAGQGLGSVEGQQPRRSVRNKRQVSYNENLSDNDGNFENLNQEGSKENGVAEGEEDSGSQKQSCGKYGSSSGTLPNGKNMSTKSKEKETGRAGTSVGNSEGPQVKKSSVPRESEKGSSSGSLEEPKLLEYADPDFNDFDALRKEGNFLVGQIWAVYDTHDGMPRFYAYIKKVFTSGFKLSITWLEADPDDDNGISWSNAELPIAVGKFRFGSTENAVDRLMFSHVLLHRRERNKKPPSYRVLPRKGETWAVFKNWDISWSAHPNSHREYEYEFAEVLSEYTEAAGVSVALLYKLKGFSCVFCRMEKGGSDVFQIPPRELYRFSHSVPSFRLTGKERKGVPEGSYELDPAALPQNIEEISVSDPPNAPAAPVETKPRSTTLDNQPSASNSDGIVIPKPRFKKFEADKSKEKLQVGQIWALYGKEDGLPRCYAKIQRVERKPELKLEMRWLETKPFLTSVKRWRDRNMPICCGNFRLKTGGAHTLTDVSNLSHQMEAKPSRNGVDISIIPKSGEVWAMYKNWSDQIKVSELKGWEYEVVEVIDVNETEIEARVLERVKGMETVFKEATAEGGGSEVTKRFPVAELLRFSHQVPKHWLTGERGGSLRGCIELDPKALPTNFFTSY